jgi:TPP-dependent pyruvate/acetoin dehydrogenase alpha subunit
MPGIIADGNDIFAVYEVARAALERARAGGGPTLIEYKTYRMRPHSNADNDLKYRTQAEIDSWQPRDPITQLSAYCLEHGLLTEAALEMMRREAHAEVDQMTQVAEATPFPDPSTLGDHLYGQLNGTEQA